MSTVDQIIDAIELGLRQGRYVVYANAESRIGALLRRIAPDFLHAPDHSGLPAATIVVAANDPLRDEGVQYADKLKSSGVSVTPKEYPALPHGFASFPHPAAPPEPARRQA